MQAQPQNLQSLLEGICRAADRAAQLVSILHYVVIRQRCDPLGYHSPLILAMSSSAEVPRSTFTEIASLSGSETSVGSSLAYSQ